MSASDPPIRILVAGGSSRAALRFRRFAAAEPSFALTTLVRRMRRRVITDWLCRSPYFTPRETTKAAEDSRTPRPRGRSGAQSVATASWSAAVLCRFHRIPPDEPTCYWHPLGGYLFFSALTVASPTHNNGCRNGTLRATSGASGSAFRLCHTFR